MNRSNEEAADSATKVAIAEAEDRVATRRFLPQTRAIEIRLQERLEEAEALRRVWKIHQAGFNTILLNCFSDGYTLYSSRTMRDYGFPAQLPVCRGTDPVDIMVKAARAKNVAVYALVDCLRSGHGAPGRNPILNRRPEWAVKGRPGSDSRVAEGFLCPVNRDVWRFLGDLFYEIVETYGFVGLYMRSLHYPPLPPGSGGDYCRCDYCRRAVHHSLGVRIGSIPEDPDHPDRYNVTAWRGRQLGNLVRYLKLRTDKACVQSLNLAEVYLGGEDLPRECVGYQDAESWAEERLVPIAAFRPPAFEEISGDDWIDRLATVSRRTAAMPVLSAAANGGLIQTLQRLATEPITGVVVSEPHDLAAPPINQLALHVWRNRTRVAEDRPAVSVCSLLAASAVVLDLDNPVRAFLQDVLRVLEPLGDRWPPAQREALYENLQGLEERIADRRLDLGDATAMTLRHFRLARRLLDLMDIES